MVMVTMLMMMLVVMLVVMLVLVLMLGLTMVRRRGLLLISWWRRFLRLGRGLGSRRAGGCCCGCLSKRRYNSNASRDSGGRQQRSHHKTSPDMTCFLEHASWANDHEWGMNAPHQTAAAVPAAVKNKRQDAMTSALHDDRKPATGDPEPKLEVLVWVETLRAEMAPVIEADTPVREGGCGGGGKPRGGEGRNHRKGEHGWAGQHGVLLLIWSYACWSECPGRAFKGHTFENRAFEQCVMAITAFTRCRPLAPFEG
jgi:hypothetical protein